MPISPALEDAIGVKIDMLDEQTQLIYAKINTLKRLIEDDVTIDAEILAQAPGFNLDTMYSNLVNTLRNYISARAQHIIDNI